MEVVDAMNSSGTILGASKGGREIVKSEVTLESTLIAFSGELSGGKSI